ncbi:MarR family winged helix-turn-helix transcriptional regulator [Ancylobacter sp. SL191]|uniref:MarR family winged helix-turn-helix transcriptional regulator n=1 Tax=Ancylobacter sp. SL191 TaxID=2995166 RepID=UPI00226DB834|nr:MarR family transcriptional regulator [Ancylobacter sp. SL191]WAC28681.1 MarR family transcriptional regulator [Ancylobacter sp. SL191]
MMDIPLGFILVDAARLYRARMDRAFTEAGLGITAGEARTLLHLKINPGLRQGALAERMSIEPMTMVGYLDRLEALGVIARDPDPSDRRAKIVRLTPDAAPLLERILAAAATAREEALDGVAPLERDALRHALQLIRANLCAPGRGESA